MTITDLIAKLQEARDDHGDLEVRITDGKGYSRKDVQFYYGKEPFNPRAADELIWIEGKSW